jgi:RNase P protein component
MKVINRIKASDDFALAIKKGRAQRNQSFVIHYRPN